MRQQAIAYPIYEQILPICNGKKGNIDAERKGYRQIACTAIVNGYVACHAVGKDAVVGGSLCHRRKL